MWLMETFMAFYSDWYDVENTSSNGGEYFIVWKDLCSSLMYANCVII